MLLANRTPHAVATGQGRDADGRPVLYVAVKTTFGWDRAGRTVPLRPEPVVTEDVVAGRGAEAVLVRAAEVGPCRPAVDVLVAGAIALPTAVDHVDCTLEIGDRLRKTVTFTSSQPFTSMPVDWRVVPNGPAGDGRGFGPLAPHWPARARHAGTYDELWLRTRAPLPPQDLRAAFHNVAPADQQLPFYAPGEEVRLHYMTVNGRDTFYLPRLREPVLIATEDALFEAKTVVDTIVIEPAEVRCSVIARVECPLSVEAPAVYEVVVGEATRAHRRALETGKRYLAWRQETPA